MPRDAPDPSDRILVVEDDDLLRMVAVDMLTDAGWSVVEAPDADAALSVLRDVADGVGLLFTDIDMPGSMDGLALAGEVHARWPHIRLVITSGRVAPRARDIPDHGRFLPKPYRRSDLLGAMA